MAALVLLLLLLFFSTTVSAQPGFLNLLCGANSSTTSDNGLSWIPDTNYIDGGTSVSILNEGIYKTIRVFEQPPLKSCYNLSVTPREKYILRLRFDTDDFQPPSLFNYSIESQDMLSMMSTGQGMAKLDERILTTSGKILYICLIKYDPDSDPFISAIQLIKLEQKMYPQVQPGVMLKLGYRYYVNDSNSYYIRYPNDPFDRRWWSSNFNEYGDVVSSNGSSINMTGTRNHPPLLAMEEALILTNNFTIYLRGLAEYKPALLFCYFAQFEENKTFSFDVFMGDANKNVTIPEKYTAEEVALSPKRRLKSYDVTFTPATADTYAILNAYEVYHIMQSDDLTNPIDVNVLKEFKKTFGLNFSTWKSDPCYGIAWEGIKCSETRISVMNFSGLNLSGHIPQTLGNSEYLEEIDLSNNRLTGTIPDLSNLTLLKTLNIQNNNLSGTLPDWLGTRKALTKLSIQNNNFSGEIPVQLIREDLQFNYSGNPKLRIPKQSSKQAQTNRRLRRGILESTLGVFFACIVIAIVVIVMAVKMRGMRHRTLLKGGTAADILSIEMPEGSNVRAFTTEEIVKATRNFSSIIGKGGFGSVYLGILENGTEIAVKLLSSKDREEFLNELHLLSVVNHKYLVSLLGYCTETHDLLLVYEYMKGGSLEDRLYGSDPERRNLRWKNRVEIALHAALGLQYLHESCTPKIIHRDVKPANILLSENLRGKLSDFGISKWTGDEQATHITTAAKGTPGYIDPEYYKTWQLTEKSDIYSFGMVLLEIICGRRPVDRTLPASEIVLVPWVREVWESNDPEIIVMIMDKNLEGRFCSIGSINRVGKVAMECINENPSARPTMNKIIAELTQAMVEEGGENSLSSEHHEPDEISVSHVWLLEHSDVASTSSTF